MKIIFENKGKILKTEKSQICKKSLKNLNSPFVYWVWLYNL